MGWGPAAVPALVTETLLWLGAVVKKLPSTFASEEYSLEIVALLESCSAALALVKVLMTEAFELAISALELYCATAVAEAAVATAASTAPWVCASATVSAADV